MTFLEMMASQPVFATAFFTIPIYWICTIIAGRRVNRFERHREDARPQLDLFGLNSAQEGMRLLLRPAARYDPTTAFWLWAGRLAFLIVIGAMLTFLAKNFLLPFLL
ncbi:MAG: hypothetical protein EON88_28425 [Brevundimonas sp.]|nr:MAG: hypothetical protein EON88_28425 [Brevundimonas sp.]